MSKSTTTLIPLSKQSSIFWKPHAYQKTGVKFLLEHAAAALFLDPGLGKTSITLAAVKILKDRGLLSKVLLIAPLRVCHLVWPNEVAKWRDFHGLKGVVLHGPTKDIGLEEDADIYVINPEGLDWLLQVEKTKSKSGKTVVSIDLRRWKKLGFDTLIVDELSKFKHTNTNRFKALKLVLHTFSRRWGLTGSPASNGLMDLFGQCFILDEGRSLGRYVTHYRSQFFEQGYDGFSWSLREGSEEQIYERIRPLALRISDEVLDMPKLVENNIEVELPNNMVQVYNQLEEDLIAKLDGGVITASTAAVASMKCRQVVSGGIYVDQDVEALVKLPKSSREWVDLHSAKTDALSDLIQELQGEPLLVAYEFGHDLERIKAKLGDIPHIGGGVSIKRSAELASAWNQGKLPVLLVQPQSVAHGLNLQESGKHICWYSLTWDYELYDQLIRRIRRQGNTAKRIYVHHLIIKDTIDEAILGALKMKKHGQEALFTALQSRKKCKEV